MVACSKENYEESCGFTHDVFLSFRGEDTRDKFTAHLLKKLQEKGINTFFDDENLRMGEGISRALLYGIEVSKISIIVFSENYAFSKWCLTELEKSIDCTEKNNKQLVFPIFYHVDPSDVRNQKNSYGKAMSVHETSFGEDSEKIQAWRSALSKAGNLKGHHIHTGSEAKHIEEIVDKVCALIAPKSLHVDKDLVGLKHRVEEVKSLNVLKDEDNKCMLVVYGQGGVGKTELAKVLYNDIAHKFEAASFLSNVGENARNKGLEHLQKTLLSEMFEPPKTELGSTYRGISEMKKRLQKKNVILVLDGIDNTEQINVLAGKPDWFGLGSVIIITTRDKTLVDHNQFEKIYSYKMTELNNQQSLELFSREVFKKSHPKRGYEDVSTRVVGYAKGLPLALQVMGTHLSTKKSIKAWQDALDEFESIPPKIQDMIRVSYDMWEHYAETVFVDISCLSQWERQEYKKIIRPSRVTSSGFYKSTNTDRPIYCKGEFHDYEYSNIPKCGNALKDARIDPMKKLQFDSFHISREEGKTICLHGCKWCKKRFPSFQALGVHRRVHSTVRAKAKQVRQVTKRSNVWPEFDTREANVWTSPEKNTTTFTTVAPFTKPNPTKSSSSKTSGLEFEGSNFEHHSGFHYNQNSIGIWSKNGPDTCKYLLIFENGEVLDFQRLSDTDVIL